MTLAFRAAQIRRAALIAALVSIYFREKVSVDDPTAVDRWLDLMVPKVLEHHERSAQDAALFGDRLRAVELPGIEVPYKYDPIISVTPEQIRSSLLSVGVGSRNKKVAEIRSLPETQFPPTTKRMLIDEADRVASERVASAVARHVQNGSRRTLEDNAKRDPMTIGYVRVTRDDPCFFCAMLASRGLEGGLYQKDSFDLSDPRFVGEGTAKVHDNCGCGIKPVYRRSDEILAQNQKFTDMWYEFSGNGDADALTNFRRNYEGRATHLKAS